jgi:acyl-CoA reductase-like NAD-dependent aldehyde dehydrogenase
MYKLINTSVIKRLIDDLFIPVDPKNADYLEFLKWKLAGNTPSPADPPTPEQIAEAAQIAKDAADSSAAKAYAKLTALKNMSPSQVQAWVSNNVTNLAQAQDAIATLAIAVSLLARRL